MPSSWLGRSWRRLGLGFAPVAIRHCPLDKRILLGAGSGADAGNGTCTGALLVDCWVASPEERSLLDVEVLLLLDLLLLMLFDLLTERQQPSDLNLGMAGRQALKGEQQTSTLNNNKLLLSQHKKLFTIPFYHLCKLLLKNPALSNL